MNSDRIREIQNTTAYPDSVSVKQALLQVWNECEQEQTKNHTISNDNRRELLISFQLWRTINEKYPEYRTFEQLLDEFLSQ